MVGRDLAALKVLSDIQQGVAEIGGRRTMSARINHDAPFELCIRAVSGNCKEARGRGKTNFSHPRGHPCEL
ncbi:hypothetical protein NN3_37050 [Nocardia neocaledoniensis NBRC 108232]|nr:hypothetical protein NN3_37050 [Nocardia neocaledoniensis NBRC 108232]